MKKILSSVLAMGMALSLVACGGSGSNSSASETAFKIGGSGPLTGDYAIYGNAVKNGAQIAVDEINAEGKIELALKMEDDLADPEQSPTCFANLQDWGMQIGLSTTTSGAGTAISQKFVETETFAITPSASNPAVIFKNDDCTEAYEYVYQMCFTDPNQGVGSADYLKAHEDIGTKVAVLYQSDENYSTSIYQKFKSEADSIGLSVVYEDSFTKDTKDFTGQLKKAKDAGADVLFLPIYYPAAALILTQSNQLGYAPSFFGVDGMDGILTLEGFDTSLAEGVYLLTPFSADSKEEKTANFVSKYKEQFGETPNQFAADAYDCVYAIAQALQAGNATVDMSNAEISKILIEQFTSMTFDGITGTQMTWAKTGEVSKAPNAVVIKDGVYVSVEG
ncbi:MAG: ABC transporter substrate-binding protein [Bacillota bacterium]|nr:ABC transporter substrate-binding protein [Bacillota bacterium]